MRVLTVRQPWAAAMFAELIRERKDVENRTWQPPARGRIAIHAAQHQDAAGFEHPIIAAAIRRGDPSWRTLNEYGHIIGSVDVVRWHRAGDECAGESCITYPPRLGYPVQTGDWSMFPKGGEKPIWHWVIRGPRRYVTPIKVRGQLGLWNPDPTTAGRIADAEREARA